MSATASALMALLGWWLLVIVAFAVYRTSLTLGGRKQANQFAPDGKDLGGFGLRLTRVHANNYENLALFGVVLVYALAAGRTTVTDGLAGWLVLARVGQGVVHLISTAVPAVMLRFTFFLIQILIVASWVVRFVS